MHDRKKHNSKDHGDKQALPKAADGSIAYHVRRLRQQYGTSGISQKELAKLAHVSRHFIEDLETLPKLQGSIELLLRVAIALEQPVTNLIAPELYRSLQEDVEQRRMAIGGVAAPKAPAQSVTPPPKLSMALVYRSPNIILAFSDGKTVYEIRQYRATIGNAVRRLRPLITREIQAYGVQETILEANSLAVRYARKGKFPYRTLTLEQAKQYLALSPDGTPLTNTEFFNALVVKHPELARYVKILPGTGRVAVSERWRTARLLAAAMALAAPIAELPPEQASGDQSEPHQLPKT